MRWRDERALPGHVTPNAASRRDAWGEIEIRRMRYCQKADRPRDSGIARALSIPLSEVSNDAWTMWSDSTVGLRICRDELQWQA